MKYSKEDLVGAFLSRYYTIDAKAFEDLEVMAYSFYDECLENEPTVSKGQARFRTYCCLEPSVMQEYLRLYG